MTQMYDPGSLLIENLVRACFETALYPTLGFIGFIQILLTFGSEYFITDGESQAGASLALTSPPPSAPFPLSQQSEEDNQESEDNQDICGICWDMLDLEPALDPGTLECECQYHERCIRYVNTVWLEHEDNNITCPLCVEKIIN